MRRVKTGRLVLCAILLLALGLAWGWWPVRNRVESIAVDGHKIEFMRYGSGRPTVVFLQGGLGGGPGLNAWAPWLPRVGTAGFCYSRPGSGNSEPANDQRTPAQIIDELHALLGLAGVPPPYVLVGGSMGGLYARAFAMRYPHEVAGLVLIDGSHERQLIEFNRADPTRYPIPPIAEPDPAKVEFAGLASTMMSGHLDVGGTLPDVPMAVITALHHAGITPQLAKAANGSFSVHNLRYSYRDR